MASVLAASRQEIEHAVHHVFLPPKVPQSAPDDTTSLWNEGTLLRMLRDAVYEFCTHVGTDLVAAVSDTHQAVSRLHELQDMTPQKLEAAFKEVVRNGGYVPIHVHAQNAGILVSRSDDAESIVFEVFELAPTNHAAMSTQGRLRRRFPGSAVAIPMSIFDDEELHRALANTLATMDRQEISEMKPRVRKAGKQQIEERDTTDPGIVTDFLATILCAIAEGYEEGGRQRTAATQLPAVAKNTREQVCWSDALLPWRRSASWLLSRVAMQIILSRAQDVSLYKELIVFFMARILREALCQPLSLELIHCMVAKISGRVQKLTRDPYRQPWLQVVEETVAEAVSFMKMSWETIARKADPVQEMRLIPAEQIERDTCIKLPELQEFLESVSERETVVHSQLSSPTWLVPKMAPLNLPSAIFDQDGEGAIVDLFAFEEWVNLSLDDWIASHVNNIHTARRLLQLSQAYDTAAQRQYPQDPDAISLKVLTILELWVACDKSVCKIHPLLQDYRHEIPTDILQSLVLPNSSQMKRLHRVETYLEARESRASQSWTPSIFSSFATINSFGVRFFASSPLHQDLKSCIETWAQRERDAKTAEFTMKQGEHRHHMARSRELSCEYYDGYNKKTGVRFTAHSKNCDKCRHKRAAANLGITVHEWPLPTSRTAAENVVFELNVPVALCSWRDATAFVILDVLRSKRASCNVGHPVGYLAKYLSSHFEVPQHGCGRFVLASTSKSHQNTHRKMQSLSIASVDDVLLANGMHYGYYDQIVSTWVMSCDETDVLPRQCTFQLSDSCAGLSQFIFRPHRHPSGKMPNHVVSQQWECAERLSLDEFKALAGLPCGYRIQWLNVLSQLHMPYVSLADPDTLPVLLQIIYQAGPRDEMGFGTTYRAGHQPLQDEKFVRTMLAGLDNALKRTKQNWEAHSALQCLVALAARALSLSPAASVTLQCLGALTACRTVALDWMALVQEKVKGAESETGRNELLTNLLAISQICIASFDVDECHLQTILSTSENAAVLLEASIVAHDASSGYHSSTSRRLRATRTLFKCFPLLRDSIVAGKGLSLDMALRKTWAAYPGTAQWDTMSETYDHWLVASTSSTEDALPLCIQYNLVTGELLVNGFPLSRLPSNYEGHSVYAKLFGKTSLEVLPTDMPGMMFSSKRTHFGYALFFGLSSDEHHDMRLVATSGAEVYELVPARVFRRALPSRFSSQYVHWYSRNSQTIEFRDKNTPWISSFKNNWVMRSEGDHWILKRRDEQVLIGKQAESARYFSHLLGPLEDESFLHIALHTKSGNIEVELPRLKLDFSLHQGSPKFRSRQFRGMYVDAKGRNDVLVGLKSKICLRNDGNRRAILVPDGEPEVFRDFDTEHVQIRIPHGASEKVHLYEVDNFLHRLVDNGSLEAKLILCHLHALTSSCLPDKLTGRTGTEQALSILRSASLNSFENLSKANVLKLERIARLSPSRKYYPAQLQCMESIQWDSTLGFLSQDNGFCEAVQDIFTRASIADVFYPDKHVDISRLEHVDTRLGQRQSIRASNFQVHGFGAENRTTHFDAAYLSRDDLRNLPRSQRAFIIGRMLLRPQTDLVETVEIDLPDVLWSFFGDYVTGPTGDVKMEDLRYDAKWMQPQQHILQNHWCQFHHLLREVSSSDLFRIFFFLSALAYADSGSLSLLQILAAIFKNGLKNESNMSSKLIHVKAPSATSFSLSEGRVVDRNHIHIVARQHAREFVDCPEYDSPRWKYEDDTMHYNRRYQEFMARKESAIDTFVASVQCQWICYKPEMDDDEIYLDAGRAINFLQTKWKSWYRNHCFYQYLREVAEAMLVCPVTKPQPLYQSPATQLIWPSGNPNPYIDMSALFGSVDILLPSVEAPHLDLCRTVVSVSKETKLRGLLDRLTAQSHSSRPYTTQYMAELEKSLEALAKQQGATELTCHDSDLHQNLRHHLRHCQNNVDEIYLALQTAITRNILTCFHAESACKHNHKALATFMAPRMSPSILLGNLAMKQCQQLSAPWRRALVLYGVALTQLQQAGRLVQTGTLTDIIQELANPGHTNWTPFDDPESLLLEVESGIMIRGVQQEIALEMRDRPKGENAVMQLNMGEGKSSVIVPIVAAHLANGHRLVRVIVAKPQAKELFRTLVAKLGGLLGRRIYHMPFNRSLRLSTSQIQDLTAFYGKCMKQGGVVLCQPEHLLSFKLMAIEYQTLESRRVAGYEMLKLYHEFEQRSRDIVDESDENFSPKFELVYTMGAQRPIELSPERWTTIQKVLGVVASTVAAVQKTAPESVEVMGRFPGRFPRTRILRDDAGERLLRAVAQKICDAGLPGLPIGRQNEELRCAILEYILTDELSNASVSAVEDSSFFTDAIKGPLLIVRGLFAGRVLLFGLKQKRWRVNYGLDGSRIPKTKLAVPYRAKDSPSPRSEFSHPDVVILLTCLSYYYVGLSNDDLFTAFAHLVKSDQADTDYERWVKDAPGLATSFQCLSGINMKDVDQVTEQIFPPLRFAKAVVDYYLSHLVFPKEMKDFPQKLSVSGWDLGEQKSNPTTGFSGTNDSSHVLPLNVKQLCIEQQVHTNALVLETLLRAENKVQHLLPAGNDSTGPHTEFSFVDSLFHFVADIEKEIHVLLDVGAQVLELTNVQVAEKWLELTPTNQAQEAVVYFDGNDELVVLDRKGIVESLRTSPYSNQLGRCFVFLDQAHTRGTDLKLPEHYRAAVTLGPDLTKDGLVQACMRMRKLGRGQSVVFCVSPEMQFRISKSTAQAPSNDISVETVLMWAVNETYADLHRVMPLWATQGFRFERQRQVWADAKTAVGIQMSPDQAQELFEEEAQTVETRYRPASSGAPETMCLPLSVLSLNADDSESLSAIRARCADFGVSMSLSAALQEEQEKELAPEIEQEREIERPDPAPAAIHQVHPDVIRFVATGVIADDSPAFYAAFTTLTGTSMAATSDLAQFPSRLLVTADYARTVQFTNVQRQTPGFADAYQRPIQWILTGAAESRDGDEQSLRAIIISPHEAHELLPQIKQSTSHARLHLYAPRTSLAFASLDELRLYTVPGLDDDGNWRLPDDLRLQLNLFAGQLYFSSYSDYTATCSMLNLAWRPPSQGSGIVVDADGFIAAVPGGRRVGSDGRSQATLSQSPVSSLKVLFMVLRRNCQEIDNTHWGRIMAGELLTEKDFVQ
ncbi:hypothetical protein BM221_003811 [Beauveria bassiana]|uniref:ubiquitinyl hydrolase 1 n=1 Tax=Beauveria bassiana TaxID=176275 RepID=A0A2N6NVP6_BEABA|nr:hypothetical protein BM221_003811 [Beauveria bassiana]